MALRNALRVDAQFQMRQVETREGYIRTFGRIAAPGIMTYRENGKEIRELIPPEVLQDPEYLASHQGLPLIDEHPKKLHMRAEEVGKERPICGSVGAGVYVDGAEPGVDVPLCLFTEQGVRNYKAGKIYLSPAYVATVDDKPGVDPVYGAYDTKQTKRSNSNHVATTFDPRGGKGMKMIKADSNSSDELPVGVQVIRADSSTAGNDPTPPAPSTPIQPPAGNADMGQLLAAMQAQNSKLDKLIEMMTPKAPKADEEEEEKGGGEQKIVADQATLDRRAAELVEVREVASRAGIELTPQDGVLGGRKKILAQRFPERIKADSKATDVNLAWDLFKADLDKAPSKTEWQAIGSSFVKGAKVRADSHKKQEAAAITASTALPTFDELPEE